MKFRVDKNKIKENIKIVYKYIANLVRKLFEEPISRFRFILVLILLVKSKLFMALLEVETADKLVFGNITLKCTVVYLSFILILYAFGYLFSKNKQIIFYILLNIFYSGLLVADLWYYRVNKDFLGIKNILYSGTFNPMGGPLLNFKPIDIIFGIDIIIMIILVIVMKVRNNEKREVGKWWLFVRYPIIMVLACYLLVDVMSIYGWDRAIFHKRWSTIMSSRASGPLGYHTIEAFSTIDKTLKSKASEKETEKIRSWIKDNKEELEPNEYSGVFEGKNVIILQVESLENFVINQKANGKEITPFMNKLTREGLYFNNIYQQNNAGNSIDCDFLVNTSVFPLGGDKITALNYSENVYDNSLPRLLKGEGYTTISTHAEEAGSFNWTELHKNGFGVDKLWTIKDYVYDETVGYGLSDKSLYTQVAEKLKSQDEPFFLQLATLSSHGPFEIDQKYRTLNLPEEIDKSYLGGYFESVCYADRQIEMLFNKLNESGLLDNTVVVIYGDHAGVHKYYNDDIQELNYEGNWWKPFDQKVPLIIYSKGVTPKVIEAAGGQVDLLPTLSYLMGIDKEKYEDTSMGRVLVNTNREATVIKDNKIVGNVKDEEEREHLLKSYDIGELIIKRNFFSNK